MIRHAIHTALLLILGAGAAMAQTPFACRIGPHAKDGHLLAERFAMVVMPEEARTEYQVTVRNPHHWPAAVLTGIDLPGIVESAAEPVMVPPRGTARVTIGWFPLDMSQGRMAPPSLDAVRAAMTVPLCEVRFPEGDDLPSAHLTVPPGGIEVVRDERAHHIHHRF